MLGCGDVHITGGSQLASTVVSGSLSGVPTRALHIGESTAVTAVLFNQLGQRVEGADELWYSSDTNVVVVNAPGKLQGVGAGYADVTVFAGGFAAVANVAVAGPVASLAITPTSSQLKVIESTAFSVVARDARGILISDPSVGWATSDPSIASIDANGRLTPLTTGNANARTLVITARSGSVSGSATALLYPRITTLFASPNSLLLRAGSGATCVVTAYDFRNAQVTNLVPVWSSLDATTATVNSSGFVLGVSGGTSSRSTQIRVTVGEQSALLNVTVTK